MRCTCSPAARPLDRRRGPLRCERDGEVTVWRDAGPPAPRWPGVRLRACLGWLGWWWSRNRFENGMRMRRLLESGRGHARRSIWSRSPSAAARGSSSTAAGERRKVVRFHSPAELIMPFYDTRSGDRRLCARLERRGFRRAAAATACSDFLAREVANRLGFRQPIVTVPNGIDLAPTDGACRRSTCARRSAATGARAAEPVVLFAGRFEPRKGSALLGELVPELLARRAVHFVVLGEDLFGHAERDLAPRCRARQGEARMGALHLLGRRAARRRPGGDAAGRRRAAAQPLGERPLHGARGDGRRARRWWRRGSAESRRWSRTAAKRCSPRTRTSRRISPRSSCLLDDRELARQPRGSRRGRGSNASSPPSAWPRARSRSIGVSSERAG